MYGVDIPGQKKYYKYVEKEWIQPTCQSGAHGGSAFVGGDNGGSLWQNGAEAYGSGVGSFNGSKGLTIHKTDGNMLGQIYCYVPEPIKVSSFTVSIGDGFYQSAFYAANGWGGTNYQISSTKWIRGGTHNIASNMTDYKQYFTFYFWYPGNYTSTIQKITFNAKTMPKLTETTEQEAEFSIDYSGIKVRYADNKYYGL